MKALILSCNTGQGHNTAGRAMLEHLQETECAANIRKAVDAVLMEKKCLTPDLHGSASTEAYRDAIIAKL